MDRKVSDLGDLVLFWFWEILEENNTFYYMGNIIPEPNVGIEKSALRKILVKAKRISMDSMKIWFGHFKWNGWFCDQLIGTRNPDSRYVIFKSSFFYLLDLLTMVGCRLQEGIWFNFLQVRLRWVISSYLYIYCSWLNIWWFQV